MLKLGHELASPRDGRPRRKLSESAGEEVVVGAGVESSLQQFDIGLLIFNGPWSQAK